MGSCESNGGYMPRPDGKAPMGGRHRLVQEPVPPLLQLADLSVGCPAAGLACSATDTRTGTRHTTPRGSASPLTRTLISVDLAPVHTGSTLFVWASRGLD